MRPQTPVHQLPISWGAESAQLIEAWLGAKVETAFNPWRVGPHPTPPHLSWHPGVPRALWVRGLAARSPGPSRHVKGMQPGLQGWTHPELLCSDLMPDSGQLQGGFPPHECVPMQEVWEHSGAGPGQGEGRPETGDGC